MGHQKPKRLHLKRHVQVLFNDDDYLRLLVASKPYGLSEWCREVLNAAVAKCLKGKDEA